MCAKGGDKSYLTRHSVSIYDFSAHMELLSGRIWISGQTFLLLLTIGKGNDEDDIIAALEHPDRVSSVGLRLTGPQLEKMATVMQEPFPALKHLFLCDAYIERCPNPSL